MSWEILTPDCPMCGTPMPGGFVVPLIVPLCTNESCPVIMWDPESTIAQNLANTKVIDDPFGAPCQNPGESGPSDS